MEDAVIPLPGMIVTDRTPLPIGRPGGRCEPSTRDMLAH